MITGAQPWFDPDTVQRFILPNIERILQSGRLILGEYTETFEHSFAKSVGTKYAVAMSSGSAALQVTMEFLFSRRTQINYPPGPALIPTNTFVATVRAAKSAGWQVLLGDINKSTFGLDIGEALKTIGAGLVVIVHIAGLIDPDTDKLLDKCKEYHIPVVEDASHAHGATLHGREAGNLGHAGCFSFYPTKVLTAGGGGMITTNDPELASYAKCARHHGASQKGLEEIILPGNNWVMSEIHAVLGLSQLNELPKILERRSQVAALYEQELANEDRVYIPPVPTGCRHAFYKQPVVLRDNCRSKLREYLLRSGIQCGALYDPPVHLQPAFRNIIPDQWKFPVADSILPRQVCLPLHLRLTDNEVSMICRAVRRGLDTV